MNCDKCTSERVANIQGKVSDMCSVSLLEKDKNGYAPDDMNIGGGDYLDFDFCLNCGKVQGVFPLAKTELEGAREESDLDETDEIKDYTIYNNIIGQWRQEPDYFDSDHDVFRRIDCLSSPISFHTHRRKELEFGENRDVRWQKISYSASTMQFGQGNWFIEHEDILVIETAPENDVGKRACRYRIVFLDDEKLVLTKKLNQYVAEK